MSDVGQWNIVVAVAAEYWVALLAFETDATITDNARVLVATRNSYDDLRGIVARCGFWIPQTLLTPPSPQHGPERATALVIGVGSRPPTLILVMSPIVEQTLACHLKRQRQLTGVVGLSRFFDANIGRWHL